MILNVFARKDLEEKLVKVSKIHPIYLFYFLFFYFIFNERKARIRTWILLTTYYIIYKANSHLTEILIRCAPPIEMTLAGDCHSLVSHFKSLISNLSVTNNEH